MGRKIAAGIFRNGKAERARIAESRTPIRDPVWSGGRASYHKEGRISPVGKQTIPGYVSFRHIIQPGLFGHKTYYFRRLSNRN